MKVLSIVLTEVKVIFKSKASLMWFFLMPLLYAFFFGLAFKGGAENKKIMLDVVSKDKGYLSKMFVRELQTEGFDINIRKRKGNEKTINSHTALIVPLHFTENILKGKKVQLVLKKKASSDVKFEKASEVNIYRAIIRTIGNLSLASFEEPDKVPDKNAYLHYRSLPPNVVVKVRMAGKIKKVPLGYNHTIPGNIVMFVLLCVLIYGIHLMVSEMKSGLLKRVVVSPIRPSTILWGKLLSRSLAGGVQVLVLFAAGYFFFKIYIGKHPVALVVLMLAYVLCVAALSMLVGSLVVTKEQASGISIVIALVMASLGGCWWPLEVVPPTIRKLAFIFPTGWTMDGIHKVMSFGYGFNSIVLNVLVLLAMFLVMFLIASKIFSRRVRSL